MITAWLTPDGGVIGDLVLFLPMLALLEAAVFVARRYEKRRLIPQRRSLRETLLVGANQIRGGVKQTL